MSPRTQAVMQQPHDTIKNIKFDGRNFPPYKASMKVALRARGLWALLTGQEQRPPSSQTDATKQFRQRVLNLDDVLTNTLNDDYKEKLDEYDSPIEKWAHLVREFEQKPFTNVHYLKKSLFVTEIEPGEAISCYWDRMMAIRRRLAAAGAKTSDEDMISAVLTGLGKEHEAIIDAFSAMQSLSLQQLGDQLKAKEERSQHLAAIGDKAGHSPVKVGDAQSVMHVNARPPMQDKRSDVCRQCGRRGHWKRDCWYNPNSSQQQQQRQSVKSSKSRGRGRGRGRGGGPGRSGRGGR